MEKKYSSEIGVSIGWWEKRVRDLEKALQDIYDDDCNHCNARVVAGSVLNKNKTEIK